MTGVQIALVALVVVLAVATVIGLAFSRWQTLNRRVGSFTCAVRRGTGDAPWVSGVAQYGAESLYWWRLWTLSPRPARTWSRSRLEVIERGALDGTSRLDRTLLVRCEIDGEQLDLVMSPEAYAGLTSWLEAAPPVGHRVI